LTPRP